MNEQELNLIAVEFAASLEERGVDVADIRDTLATIAVTIAENTIGRDHTAAWLHDLADMVAAQQPKRVN